MASVFRVERLLLEAPTLPADATGGSAYDLLLERCRCIWLSATVDPAFYARYLESVEVLETRAFDPAKAANVRGWRRDWPMRIRMCWRQPATY